MNPIVFVIAVLLVLSGAGFYYGGAIYGTSGLVVMLPVCFLVFLCGGFRSKR